MLLIRSLSTSSLVVGLVLLLVQGAFGHTYLSSVVLGGAALSEGDCVRPHPSSGKDSPISLVSSPDMTCGFLPAAGQAANRKCPIAAGSQLGIQWHHSSAASTDDILDPSHKGPVIVYLAKSDTGAGNVWFKIWQDGYDQASGTWATDRLIAQRGLITVTIPSDIAPGNYLLRGEVLALHNAYNVDGVQPYVGCVELSISGSGSSNPAGVAFPGYYVDTNPSLLINIYQAFPLPYVIPGPALYTSASSTGSSTPTSAPTSTPTSAPTSTPTAAPTSNPTSAPPTSYPTSAPPTSYPTSAPPTSAPPTSTPTAPPTSAPSGGSPLTVALHGGSSSWWLGVDVSGGSQTTAAVEIKDSGSLSTWTALTNAGYSFVMTASAQITLPVSVRLTSSTGAQVTLTNVFTSWANTAVNTGKDYGSSGSQPAPAATTAASAPTQPASPTSAPTTAPTSPPSSSSSQMSLTVRAGVTPWWFAVSVGGVPVNSIGSVELKDSGFVTSYALMTSHDWGYDLGANAHPFVAPLTLRVTNTAGQSSTFAVASITPGAQVSACSTR